MTSCSRTSENYLLSKSRISTCPLLFKTSSFVFWVPGLTSFEFRFCRQHCEAWCCRQHCEAWCCRQHCEAWYYHYTLYRETIFSVDSLLTSTRVSFEWLRRASWQLTWLCTVGKLTFVFLYLFVVSLLMLLMMFSAAVWTRINFKLFWMNVKSGWTLTVVNCCGCGIGSCWGTVLVHVYMYV